MGRFRNIMQSRSREGSSELFESRGVDLDWIQSRSLENMMGFYEPELRFIYETKSVGDISKKIVHRLRVEGWIMLQRKARSECIYHVSDEVIRKFNLE